MHKWVRALKHISRHDLTGMYKTYQPGDFFQCNNQELRNLLERGLIETAPDVLRAEYNLDNAGVLVRSGVAPTDCVNYGLHVERADRLALPWELNVLWRGNGRVNALGIALGLTRVQTNTDDVGWEMAVALRSHAQLAENNGSPEDRQKTLDLLGEIRLPVYDTCAVWVRRTPATEEVIQRWQAELDAGGGELHSFLRALYTTPVLLCTLPADWIGQWAWA